MRAAQLMAGFLVKAKAANPARTPATAHIERKLPARNLTPACSNASCKADTLAERRRRVSSAGILLSCSSRSRANSSSGSRSGAFCTVARRSLIRRACARRSSNREIIAKVAGPFDEQVVIDGDQLQNAARLAEAGAAWPIAQKELTPESLASALGRLLTSPDLLAAAAAAAKRQGRPDAVERLADLVEELVGSGAKSA